MKSKSNHVFVTLLVLLISQEALFAADPIGVAGSFTGEQWTNVSAEIETVGEIYGSDSFYEAIDVSEQVISSRYLSFPTLSIVRMRGFITAPVTGEYHFWVSARSNVELWLSTDSTKYRKQRIARIDPDENGRAVVIFSDDTNLYDRFSVQMSDPVTLTAGQKYFIEAYHKNNTSHKQHISLAWAVPGGVREEIPIAQVSSFDRSGDTDDLDDDYLPDSWEALYPGLDANNNGATDRDTQGERGDLDLDGLSNREEYVHGTDPSSADTDGDGISDVDEVRAYGTDPTVSDAPGETVTSTLDLSTYTSSLNWTNTSRGLIPETFRGNISWPFSVPSAGHWNINIQTSLLGDLFDHEAVEVEAFIDGVSLGMETVVYGNEPNALIRLTTPEIAAGGHTLRLYIDNRLGRRAVVIKNIQVLQPTGADLNNDGIPDWIVSRLNGLNSLEPYQATSRTSPTFLEGQARTSVTLPEGTIHDGVDQNHWFADLPLNDTGATPFTVSYEAGLSESGSITWSSTNVLEGESLVVRKGDSLKLTAVPSGGATGQGASLVIPGSGNIAINPLATATQSSTINGGVASRAIDGNTSRDYVDNSITHTADEAGAWWQVDLGGEYSVEEVILWNRGDNVAYRLSNYAIQIFDASGTMTASQSFHTTGSSNTGLSETWTLPSPATGQTIKVVRLGPDRRGNESILSLAEVQVFGDQVLPLATDSDFTTFTFNTAGTHQILGSHDNGDSGTLTVTVKQAEFTSVPKDLVSIFSIGGSPIGFTFDSNLVDSSLYFDAGDEVELDRNLTFSGDLFTMPALARARGQANLLARLFEDGPVVGVKPLNLIGISDSSQGGFSTYFLPSDDEVSYTTVTILATDLPPGGYIEMRMFFGYTELLDGGTSAIYTADDFENGMLQITVRSIGNVDNPFCHDLRIHDRDGNLIAIF